jgi:hypothetical protein
MVHRLLFEIMSSNMKSARVETPRSICRGVDDDDDAWTSRNLAKTGRRAPCFRVGSKSLRQRGSRFRRQVRPHAAPLSGPLRVGLDRTFVVRKHPHGLAIYAVLKPLSLTLPSDARRCRARQGETRGRAGAVLEGDMTTFRQLGPTKRRQWRCPIRS